MKNISFLLVLVFTSIAYLAQAQPTFRVTPDFQLVDEGEQVCYDVNVADFTDIMSVSFTLEWDPGVATFNSISFINPNLNGFSEASSFDTSQTGEGFLILDWSNGFPCNSTDPIAAEDDLDDFETMFTVCFIATGEYGNHTPIEITDSPMDKIVKRFSANCQDIGEFTYDGFLSIGTEPLGVNISSADGFQGETVCIDFKVEDFDNLITNQYYIFWNPNVMIFEDVLPSGIPSFSMAHIGTTQVDQGLVTISWNATSGSVSVPDGTQIMQMCFKIVGNCGQSSPIYIDDNGDEEIEIIDEITQFSNGTNIGLLDSPGEVSVKCFNPNGINMIIEDKDVCPGENFTVDIKVSNFDNIFKLNFGLKWNPAVIQLNSNPNGGISFPQGFGCQGFGNIPSTFDISPAEGTIEMDWTSAFGGCDMTDDMVLLRLHFTAIGASATNSTIAVVNPILVDVFGGLEVNVGINNDNGLVSICELISPTLIASSGAENPGEQICISVTSLGFEGVTALAHTISWEPNILSFTHVENFNPVLGFNQFNFLINQTQAQGNLGVVWGNGSAGSVPDGTVLFDICFDVVGDPDSCSLIQFTDNFVPINVVTEESNGTDVGLNGQSGEACVLNPFEFVMLVNDIFGTPGEQVCVDVTTENFNQLTRLQHSMSWKNNILQYDTILSTGNLPGFNVGHFDDSSPDIDNGQLTINWSTNNINGISVPDGAPVFQVCFTIIGDPGDCSGVNIDNWVAPFVVNSAPTGGSNLGLTADNGSICVNSAFVTLIDVQINHVECPSLPTGIIDLTIAGGSGEYSYNWEGPGAVPTTEDQNGLFPGMFFVTVTDIENPSLDIELNFQVELLPNAPIADAGVDTSFSCSSGLFTLVLNGGGSPTSGVSYEWENIAGSGIIIDGGDTQFPTVIGGSAYQLTLTQNQTGCVVIDTVNVSAPIIPVPNIDTTTLQEISCTQDTIFLNGGQPQPVFGFEWIAGPNGHIVPGTETTLQPLITEPGWYYLEMSHFTTGCSGLDSIFIEDHKIDPVSVAGDDLAIDCTVNSIQLDGTASSVSNVTYEWSVVSTGGICGDVDGMSLEVCSPGTYQLLVTDTLNGCSALDFVVVEADTLKPIANAGLDTAITCSVLDILLDGTASSQGNEFNYIWKNEMGDTLGTDLTLLVDTPGDYTLEVMDSSNGCISLSEVLVADDDDLPQVMATVDHAITCDSATANLDGTGSSEGAEFSYQWLDPLGGFAGDELSIVVSEPGTYTLTVFNSTNDCDDSIEIEIEDQNDPVPVEAGLNEIIGCDGNVQLEGQILAPNVNLQVQWIGPGAVNCITNSSSLTPTIDCDGWYKMLVFDTLTGCTGIDSLFVEPDFVAPVISAGDDTVFPCSDILFELTGTSDISNITVQWSNASMNTINNATTLTPTIEIPDTYTLTVTSNSNQCSSTASVVVSVPDDPIATIDGPDEADCSNPIVTLTGAGSTAGVEYLWEALSGMVNSGEEELVSIEVGAGVYQLTVIDTNGCTGLATHEVAPDSEAPTADAGMDAEILCDEGVVQLDGSNSDPNLTYLWFDENGIVGSGLVVEVTDPGVYYIQVTNAANNCQSTDTVAVTQATGDVPAEASFDFDPCDTEAVLMGNLPSGASGTWTTSSGAFIDQPNAETAIATGLPVGESQFIWTLTLGSCIDYSSASVSIEVDQSVPNPFTDVATLTASMGDVISVNVLENDDFDSTQMVFNVIGTNIPGEVTFTDDGIITFTKLKCFVGLAEIEYEVCNINCPELCGTTTLRINVEAVEGDGCDKVPNGITPNGDGVNDELIFDVLLNTTEDFPDNEMIIFNRWGDIVYQARPYLNDWTGTNDSGDRLPHGTYYYILRLNLGDGLILRGDVTIME